MSNRADESGLDGDQRQRIHGLNPPTPDRVTSDKQGPDEPTGASSILSLQQKAGNAAVADLLERRLEPVQRAPTAAVEVKPGADVTRAAGQPQLSGGSGGPPVSELQQRLNLAVAEAKLPVTGNFDSRTTQVVERFQTRSGLEPDGTVGPDTWAALGSVTGGQQISPEEEARMEAQVRAAGVQFAGGDFSGALSLLTRLYTDPLLAHKPDSLRAAVTYNIAACHHQLGEMAEAISYYQEVMGMPAAPSDQRGNAAENLRRARLGLPFQTRAEMEQDLTGGTAHSPLSAGSGGPEVSELQQKLNLAVAEARLPVTGSFDSRTTQVVERFQTQSGLEPDGIVGPDTWSALDAVAGGQQISREEEARMEAQVRAAGVQFAAGDFSGGLSLLTRLYTDPLLAHKPDSLRAAVTYNMAACHHQLGELAEAKIGRASCRE